MWVCGREVNILKQFVHYFFVLSIYGIELRDRTRRAGFLNMGDYTNTLGRTISKFTAPLPYGHNTRFYRPFEVILIRNCNVRAFTSVTLR